MCNKTLETPHYQQCKTYYIFLHGNTQELQTQAKLLPDKELHVLKTLKLRQAQDQRWATKLNTTTSTRTTAACFASRWRPTVWMLRLPLLMYEKALWKRWTEWDRLEIRADWMASEWYQEKEIIARCGTMALNSEGCYEKCHIEIWQGYAMLAPNGWHTDKMEGQSISNISCSRMFRAI